MLKAVEAAQQCRRARQAVAALKIIKNKVMGALRVELKK
jgi:hypothetical protein